MNRVHDYHQAPGDVAILQVLAKWRWATIQMCCMATDRSAATMYRRTRKLARAGLIRIKMQRSTAALPRVIGLTQRGKAILCDHGHDPLSINVPRADGRPGEHHLQTGILALKLARAAVREGLDVDVLPEQEIRKRLQDPCGTVIPDAIVTVDNRCGQRLSLALELDRSTMPPSRVANDKLRRGYGPLFRAGVMLNGARFAVLVGATSKRRVHSLARAIWECAEDVLCYFATSGDVTVENALAAWVTPRIDPIDGHARLVIESPIASLFNQGVQKGCSNALDSPAGAGDRNLGERASEESRTHPRNGAVTNPVIGQPQRPYQPSTRKERG